MIGTNARTANGIVVVRRPSLREWLVPSLGESSARVRADDPDGVVCAAQDVNRLGHGDALDRQGAKPHARDLQSGSSQYRLVHDPRSLPVTARYRILSQDGPFAKDE